VQFGVELHIYLNCADGWAGQFDDLVFLRFLKSHSCYDVLPASNKVVVLDTQLNVSGHVTVLNSSAYNNNNNNNTKFVALHDAVRQLQMAA